MENILEAAMFFLASSDGSRFSNQSDPGRKVSAIWDSTSNNGTAILPPKSCKWYTCSGETPLTLIE